MNEALQKELISIIQDSHNGILNGIQFAKAKAPELVNQILAYGFYHNLTMLIIGLTMLIFGLFLLKIAVNYAKDNEGDAAGGCFLIGVVIIVIGFLFSVFSINTLIQIKTSPYLYLLEYVKDLVK
jgi:hypothetical protein